MPSKNITKTILICSSLLLVFAAAVFFAALFVKNKVSDVEFLKEIVYKNSDLVLSVQKIDASYSGLSFVVRSPYISVSEPESTTPFIEGGELSFKVRILPLLLKKLSINEFSADFINLNGKRLKDGSFDFAKYFKKKNSGISVDLSSLRVLVPKYNIRFNDFLTKNNVLLSGVDFNAAGLNLNKKFALKTNGMISIENSGKIKTSPFLIDVDYVKHKGSVKLKKHEVLLSSVDLSFLKSYFNFLNSADGEIDIDSKGLKSGDYRLYFYLNNINFAFNYKNDKNTITSNKQIICQFDFNFLNKDLLIKNADVTGENINIIFEGKIKNFFDIKHIEPELKIKIKNTFLDNLIEILPDTLIPFQEPYIKKLKLYKVNAVIDGNLDVRFKDPEDFSVLGKADFNDVYIKERPKDSKTSFGDCEFKGRDVVIRVFANAPNDAMLTVFGETKMQKLPPGKFLIKSHGDLDLAFAHKILMPIQDILALKLGPLPYMTLDGDGKIELSTKGTKEKSSLDGYFSTNNATVTMRGLNAVLKNGSVKILFNDDKIIINDAKGIIDGSVASINGKSNTNGDIDFDILIKDIAAKNAMHIAQTSSIVLSALDGGEFLKSFKPASGKLDFYINLSGNVPVDAEFGAPVDTVLAKGKIVFNNINLIVDPKIKGENLSGVLNFKDNADFDLDADIFGSPFKIKGSIEPKKVKNKIVKGAPSNLDIRFIFDKTLSRTVGDFIIENIELFVPQNRLFAKNLAQIFKTNKFLMKGDIQAKGLIYPSDTTLDLSRFDFKGNLSGINSSSSDFSFGAGNIELRGKNAKFNNLKLNADGIDFSINGNIDKFASITPFNNLNLVFLESSFLSYVQMFKKLLPDKMKPAINNFDEFGGTVKGKIKLYGNKIDGEFLPSGASFIDKKAGHKIAVNSGKIKLKNEKTYFNAFNLSYGGLPLFLDGFVQTDGDINPEFNIFLTTNLSEEHCDKLLNPYLHYPLLLQGEMVLKTRLQGRMDSYTNYTTLVLNEGSDLSFMGFKFGDIDSKREVSSKINFGNKIANVNYIRYFKYVASQSNKLSAYDLFNASGKVILSNGGIVFDNFKLVTPNPAPVRFLNLLFKKSLVKDGLFTSDLLLNGPVSNINAKGDLAFSNVVIPIYNSTVEDIKIKLTEKTGQAVFKLSSFGTTGDFTVDFENKTSLPFIIDNFSVHSNEVSISNLMNAFSVFAGGAFKTNIAQSQTASYFSPSDIQIKKGNLNIDKILFNDVEAQNLKLNFSHSENAALKIDDAYLAIAGGLIKGSGEYNFDTKDISVNSDFINCDANELTKAFFNLSGQIYGNANGKFVLSMKDFDQGDYINKINVDAEFEILNGRLPKLGSIEYLLRASNFFKSGIFGLTINNVIELLTPYKHGDFNKISGNLKISDANIKELKLYSQGDNLSTYTYGSYDILSGLADIEILGKLSKNISNLLGPLGNASMASVLNVVTRNKMSEIMKNEILKNVNKIPLINLNNDDFRLFNVKLQGKVTADDIVKSFHWLN